MKSVRDEIWSGRCFARAVAVHLSSKVWMRIWTEVADFSNNITDNISVEIITNIRDAIK